MKRHIIAALVASSFAAPFAWGGNEVNTPVYAYVTADGVNGQISGSLTTAHNASDDMQYLECSTSAYTSTSGTTWTNASCSGRTSTGRYAGCWTNNPQLVEAIGRLGDGKIDVYLSYGKCNSIEVEHSSHLAARKLLTQWVQ